MSQASAEKRRRTAALALLDNFGMVQPSGTEENYLLPYMYTIRDAKPDYQILPVPYVGDVFFGAKLPAKVPEPALETVGPGHKVLVWHGADENNPQNIVFDLATGLDFVCAYMDAAREGVRLVPAEGLRDFSKSVAVLNKYAQINPDLSGKELKGVAGAASIWWADSKSLPRPARFMVDNNTDPAQTIPKGVVPVRPYGLTILPYPGTGLDGLVKGVRYVPFGPDPHNYGQAVKLRADNLDGIEWLTHSGDAYGFTMDEYYRELYGSPSFIHPHDFVVGLAGNSPLRETGSIPRGAEGKRPMPLRYGRTKEPRLLKFSLIDPETASEKQTVKELDGD